MSALSIALQSTEKASSFPLKDISLDSATSAMLTRKNWLENWNDVLIIGFKLRDFYSINKQTTIITIVMQIQAKFCLPYQN